MSIKLVIEVFFFFVKLLILIWEWKRLELCLIGFIKVQLSHIYSTVTFDVFHDIVHSMALLLKTKNDESKWNKQDNRFSEELVSEFSIFFHGGSLSEFSHDQNKK